MSKTISVSQLNSYIKRLFGSDENLADLMVRGEISNFKLHHSGHMYFTLKDDRASVKCIMFSSYAGRLLFRPSDGMQVTASGYVSVYEKSGQYQLYVSGMMEEGEGALYVRFEKLKKKLSDEGLFDESKKKAIPVYPGTIGVITSSTGSVIRDIINVLDRRFPKYRLVLYPSHVQGKGAELEIASGIRYFNDIRPVDVIIVARGGGSIEDLWPFNEEVLARAISASDVPVISAVGHETDFTIADFTADMRAPTPSAAAELAVPELSAIIRTLEDSRIRLKGSMSRIIDKNDSVLKSIISRPVMARPDEIFNMASLAVDRLSEKMQLSFSSILERKDADYREMASKLALLSPLGTISRGYSIVTNRGEHVITSIAETEPGEEISARVTDGRIISEVIRTEESNGK